MWTAIMVPYYGYGETTATSAASESNFNVIKHKLLQHITLPCRIDGFLEEYVPCLSSYLKIEESRASGNNRRMREDDTSTSDQSCHTKSEHVENGTQDNIPLAYHAETDKITTTSDVD